MPFVTGEGRVVQQHPWSLNYIKRKVLEIFNVFLIFFQTLLPLDLFRDRLSHQQSYGDRRPPRPPGRRFGRIGCQNGVDAPPMSGGG